MEENCNSFSNETRARATHPTIDHNNSNINNVERGHE